MTDNTKDALQHMAKDALEIARKYVESQNHAEGLLDGFGGRKPHPSDGDLKVVNDAIAALTSPDPKEAEQDEREALEADLAWHKEALARHSAKLKSVWEELNQARAALSAQSVREQALEEAAKVCDAKARQIGLTSFQKYSAEQLAAAIRALSSQPAQIDKKGSTA